MSAQTGKEREKEKREFCFLFFVVFPRREHQPQQRFFPFPPFSPFPPNSLFCFTRVNIEKV